MRRLCLLSAFALFVPEQDPDRQPVFRSGINVVAYDFTAVDRDGRAIADLTAPELTLRVNGRARQILSIEYVGAMPAEPAAVPAPYSSNARAIAARTLVIAIDDEHLPVGEARGILSDASALLDQLAPGDRAGLLALKGGGARVELTTDIGVVRDALGQIDGKGQRRPGEFNITPAEAMAFLEGNQNIAGRVIDRECGMQFGAAGCRERVAFEAEDSGRYYERTTRATLQGLTSLFENLAAVEGPKAVVIVSDGIVGTVRTRVDLRDLADAAARARVSVFVLQQFNATGGAADRVPAYTALEDANLRGAGLQEITDVTGGASFRASGSARAAIARIAGELSGYYLLTFEPAPGEREDRLQRIELRVARDGVTLRARPRFTTASTASGSNRAETRDALVRATEPHRELPLRVATYAQRGAQPGTVTLVVLADTPAALSQPIPATFALVTHDLKLGSQWTASLAGGGAAPTPSAASVPAGRYRLRVAAMSEDGARGTVEHAVNASLTAAGSLQVSDLILGVATGDSFTPRLDFARADARAVGYIEVYGRLTGTGLSLALERAATPDGESLEALPMTLQQRGEASHFATAALSLADLTPGDHIVRVVLRVDHTVVARVTRTLRVDR